MDKSTLKTNSKNGVGIIGFGGVPDGLGKFTQGLFNYFNANISSKDKKIEIKEASSGTYNAKYILDEANKVALAKADGARYLISARFTGCIFQLWEGEGDIIGAHAYKGVSKTASIESEAGTHGWKRLFSFDTAGKIDTSKGQQGLVVSMIESSKIETVILALEGGKAVAVIAEETTSRTG